VGEVGIVNVAIVEAQRPELTSEACDVDVFALGQAETRARRGQLVNRNWCAEEGDALNTGRADGREFALLWDVRGEGEGNGEVGEAGKVVQGGELGGIYEGEADDEVGVDLRKETATEDEVNAVESAVRPFDHFVIVHSQEEGGELPVVAQGKVEHVAVAGGAAFAEEFWWQVL